MDASDSSAGYSANSLGKCDGRGCAHTIHVDETAHDITLSSVCRKTPSPATTTSGTSGDTHAHGTIRSVGTECKLTNVRPNTPLTSDDQYRSVSIPHNHETAIHDSKQCGQCSDMRSDHLGDEHINEPMTWVNGRQHALPFSRVTVDKWPWIHRKHPGMEKRKPYELKKKARWATVLFVT